MEWGASAGDNSRVYVQITNSYGVPYHLINGQTTSGGAWSALDAAMGKILWQTADPQGAIDPGAITTANSVVFARSLARTGNNMYELDAATGHILWSFASGGSVNSGASVVDGVVYWGSGYAHFGLGTGNNKLYAFSLNGQ